MDIDRLHGLNTLVVLGLRSGRLRNKLGLLLKHKTSSHPPKALVVWQRGFWSSKQALDWVDAAKGDVSAAAWTELGLSFQAWKVLLQDDDMHFTST